MESDTPDAPICRLRGLHGPAFPASCSTAKLAPPACSPYSALLLLLLLLLQSLACFSP